MILLEFLNRLQCVVSACSRISVGLTSVYPAVQIIAMPVTFYIYPYILGMLLLLQGAFFHTYVSVVCSIILPFCIVPQTRGPDALPIYSGSSISWF